MKRLRVVLTPDLGPSHALATTAGALASASRTTDTLEWRPPHVILFVRGDRADFLWACRPLTLGRRCRGLAVESTPRSRAAWARRGSRVPPSAVTRQAARHRRGLAVRPAGAHPADRPRVPTHPLRGRGGWRRALAPEHRHDGRRR